MVDKNLSTDIKHNDIAKRRHLFMHLATGSLIKNKSRLLIALASVIIAASVVSSMSSVYFDITNKMGRELRNYGANLIILPKSKNLNGTFLESKLTTSNKNIPSEKIIGAAPYLYNIADVISGSKIQRLVVAGTNFKEAEKVSPYWKIKGKLPQNENEILVGTEVSEKLRLKTGNYVSIKLVEKNPSKNNKQVPCLNCHQDALNSPKKKSMKWVNLKQCTTCHQPHPLDIFDNKLPKLEVVGIVNSGGAEDNQVFIKLDKAQTIFKKPKMISSAYLSILGQTNEIKRFIKLISKEDSSLMPRPIKRISQSEGHVLLKVQNLVYPIVVMILLSTILGVMITMIAMALERKREIGLKKAIGAEDKDIALEFLGEAALLGLVGGILGWIIGLMLAQWIGQAIFNSTISLRIITIPLTLLTSLFVTGLAALAPVRIATRINPAIVLKEE